MSLCLADTHAHLADESLLPDIGGVVERASQAGVTRILTVGTDLATSQECVALADRFSLVYAAVGVHPLHSTEALGGLSALRSLAAHPKVVAIGEIGLDYYREYADPAVQRRAFVVQLELAAELERPVIIHNREADHDVLADLAAVERPPRLAGRSGVLHCFVGSADLADAAWDLGFRVSFAGNLTYKKSADIRDVAARLPLERILVETDSPYLSPEGRRGRTNAPEHVTLVAARLAEIRGTPLELVADQTSANARDLFHWA